MVFIPLYPWFGGHQCPESGPKPWTFSPSEQQLCYKPPSLPVCCPGVALGSSTFSRAEGDDGVP